MAAQKQYNQMLRSILDNTPLRRFDMVTVEEAKAMLGTEFIFVFDDGDTIPAYVKAFDQEVGLSCYTLEAQTAGEWDNPGGDEKEADGTFCVLAVNTAPGWEGTGTVEDALKIMTEIKTTGRFTCPKVVGMQIFAGCAF